MLSSIISVSFFLIMLFSSADIAYSEGDSVVNTLPPIASPSNSPEKKSPAPASPEVKEKKPEQKIELPIDSPWTLNREGPSGLPAAGPPPAFEWQSAKQQERCNDYAAEARSSFIYARYYSIQGEPCVCAQYAAEFRTIMEKASNACPQDFFLKLGYSSRIVKNIAWLEKLGKDRCSGRPPLVAAPKTEPQGSVSSSPMVGQEKKSKSLKEKPKEEKRNAPTYSE